MMTSQQTKAQNLVPNPSFENYTIPPTPGVPDVSTNPVGFMWVVRLNDPTFLFQDPDNTILGDQRHVHNWFRANQATTDYYRALPTSGSGKYTPLDDTHPDAGVNVPQNWGQEDNLYANSGNAYTGIAINRANIADGTAGTKDWHEYLAVKLPSSLLSGKKYAIKFHYAIADYRNDRQKSGNKGKSPHFLRNLGVAFASDNTFVDYDQSETWASESGNAHYNALTSMTLNNDNYVEKSNLEYAPPGQWKEFEAYFQCPTTVSTLQYVIIGNFQYRIPLTDIDYNPNYDGAKIEIDEGKAYSFYFFIDDVSVVELETGACDCGSIFTCPHSRNEELEETHENSCCFTTPIIPDKTRSCVFTSVRVTNSSGVVISDPPLVTYDGVIKKFPDELNISFCTPKKTDEEKTFVKYEFLDASGNVICFKTEEVQCNCDCQMAKNIIEGPDGTRGRRFIEPTFTKIANENGDCCWEYSIRTNWSCTFLGNYGFEINLPTGTTITPISPWTETHVGSKYFFSSPTGLKYSKGPDDDNTVKIFKVCTDPQIEGTPAPYFYPIFKDNTIETICKKFPSLTLECKGSENCCDQLDIKLRPWGYIDYGPCKVDFIVRQKSSLTKCDVYGIRIKSGTTTLHTTTTGVVLNLDWPTQIWLDKLANCGVSLETGELVANCRTYTIEILGPNDSFGNPTVKCSVEKEFCCCKPRIPDASKLSLEEETKELPSGGIITDATITGSLVHYTVKNNGDAINATLQLSSLTGNIILQKQINLITGNNINELDISKISSGTYFLNIQTDLWQTARQIIIVK